MFTGELDSEVRKVVLLQVETFDKLITIPLFILSTNSKARPINISAASQTRTGATNINSSLPFSLKAGRNHDWSSVSIHRWKISA